MVIYIDMILEMFWWLIVKSMDNMCMHRNKSEQGDWWFWWLSAAILIIRTKNEDYGESYDEMWSVCVWLCW